VLFIAALADAPSATQTYDGHDTISMVKAKVEALLTALEFGTNGRYELEQRLGGDPSDNTKADYASRISASEAQLITLVGGSVSELQARLATLPRVAADPAARSAAEKLGDTTGQITIPTLTMHTEDDPLVLVQNETVLSERARQAGRSGNLVQLYVGPPATYSEQSGAPYGAGHCNFTDSQRIGLLTVLDNWVRKSAYPVPAGITAIMGEGYSPVFAPGPWPGVES
jgi:hypothetical protein